jgi:hypothetical protein
MQRLEDTLRMHLGGAIRAALVEQALLGEGFDPEHVADAIQCRVADAIRENLAEGLRERIRESLREHLGEAVRSVLSQSPLGAEVAEGHPVH